MSDIFISYAREDRSRVEPLAKALEGQGWSVFWDRTIPAGKTWRQVIGNALESARSVIVAWSKTSVDSRWVQEEADRGLERNILIPILIDNVRPPLGFGTIQAADLISWQPTQSSPEFEKLIADISAILRPSPVKVKEAEQKIAEETHLRKPEEERRLREIELRRAEEERQRLEEDNQHLAEEKRKFEEDQKRMEAARKAGEELKQKKTAAQHKDEEQKQRKEKVELRLKSEEELKHKKSEEEQKRKVKEERKCKEAEANHRAEEERKRKVILGPKLTCIPTWVFVVEAIVFLLALIIWFSHMLITLLIALPIIFGIILPMKVALEPKLKCIPTWVFVVEGGLIIPVIILLLYYFYWGRHPIHLIFPGSVILLIIINFRYMINDWKKRYELNR